MDKEAYRHAFCQLKFSAQLEDDVMKKLHDEPGEKRRKINFKRGGVAAAFLCILIMSIHIFSSDRILSREAKKNMDYISKFSVEKLDDFTVSGTKVRGNEMLILELPSEIQKNRLVSVTGDIKQQTSSYEIGYIHDGEYTKLEDAHDKTAFTAAFCTSDSGQYYFCVSNLMADSLSITAVISVSTNDLIYQTGAVHLAEGSTVTINTEALTSRFAAFYLENCQTGEILEIPYSSKKIGIAQDGSYRIFGITSEHEILDLKNYISVQLSSMNSEGDSFTFLGY